MIDITHVNLSSCPYFPAWRTAMPRGALSELVRVIFVVGSFDARRPRSGPVQLRSQNILRGECLLSGRGCALARHAELDFTLADLLVREERMVGGVVADESSNLSCGGLGPETADDTEKKLMFAAQHSGSFVSNLPDGTQIH